MSNKEAGLFGKNRRMWSKLDRANLIGYVIPSDGEIGPEVVATFGQGKSRHSINLTSLTEEELLVFKRFIDIMVAAAMPVVQDRDQIAEVALADGITDYPRCFVATPRLWIREGKEFSDTITELPAEPLDDDRGRKFEKKIGGEGRVAVDLDDADRKEIYLGEDGT